MKFLGIIPARYGATRFPGKLLIQLKNKPLIQLVYEQVRGSLDQVVVATDDSRIYQVVKSFGGQALMTSIYHKNGTARCYEAYILLNNHYDVILNIQGDEPFISSRHIELIKSCFLFDETKIATLIKPFDPDEPFENLFDPNTPKVIINDKNDAIYFSRSIIPYCRKVNYFEWVKTHTYYKHIGLYGYRPNILEEIVQLPISNLEKVECLEQLRWIENGYIIQTAITYEESFGINTPADLKKVIQMIKV